MEKKYKGRVWATKVLLKEAENQIDTIISALCPENYEYGVKSCDKEVDGFPYSSHYTHMGYFKEKIDPQPRWICYAHSEGGAKASLLGLMFKNIPCFPLTK